MATYRITVHIEGLLNSSVFVISFGLTSMRWSHALCREDGIPRSTNRRYLPLVQRSCTFFDPAVPHLSFDIEMRSMGFLAVGFKRCGIIGRPILGADNLSSKCGV